MAVMVRRHWRLQERQDVEAYREHTMQLVNERLAVGEKHYRTGHAFSRFRGDPIKHATEEVGDLVYYLHYIERRDRHRVDMLNKAAHLLMAAMENCRHPHMKFHDDATMMVEDIEDELGIAWVKPWADSSSGSRGDAAGEQSEHERDGAEAGHI